MWTHAQNCSARQWWEDHAPAKTEQARRLAVKVMSLPASTAASERVWSAFGNVCSKKRTRLSPDRLIKCVYINWNHRILNTDSEDQTENDTEPDEEKPQNRRVAQILEIRNQDGLLQKL